MPSKMFQKNENAQPIEFNWHYCYFLSCCLNSLQGAPMGIFFQAGSNAVKLINSGVFQWNFAFAFVMVDVVHVRSYYHHGIVAESTQQLRARGIPSLYLTCSQFCVLPWLLILPPRIFDQLDSFSLGHLRDKNNM